MSLPDFVNETLAFIDTNWNTSNYSPKPTLIDGDEMRDFNDDTRTKGVDVINTNVVTVDASPTGTAEPAGLEYDRRIRFPVNIQVEGYHTDGGGEVADKDDFDSLTTEVKRTVFTERVRPTNVTDIQWLEINQENDLSAEQGDAHYFRYEFDMVYVGYERDLP